MKINAFADVSLRALLVLAAAPDGGLLTTQSIADAVGTPYNHVSKAMARLRALGMIDVEQGAQTTLYCATSPRCANETGLYYDKSQLRTASSVARDPELARKLWTQSEAWLA